MPAPLLGTVPVSYVLPFPCPVACCLREEDLPCIMQRTTVTESWPVLPTNNPASLREMSLRGFASFEKGSIFCIGAWYRWKSAATNPRQQLGPPPLPAPLAAPAQAPPGARAPEKPRLELRTHGPLPLNTGWSLLGRLHSPPCSLEVGAQVVVMLVSLRSYSLRDGLLCYQSPEYHLTFSHGNDFN